MAWRLLGKLDDELAQVCFEHVDSGGDQRVVQTDFLADHALALGHAADVVPGGDVLHLAADFRRIGRPEDGRAVRGKTLLSLLQQRGKLA